MSVLKHWLKQNPPVPLAQLQRGFLHLPEERAKAAYAQSLFAVKDLIATQGFFAFGSFFRKLAMGQDSGSAFAAAFGIPLHRFQQRLNIKLEKWAAGFRQ